MEKYLIAFDVSPRHENREAEFDRVESLIQKQGWRPVAHGIWISGQAAIDVSDLRDHFADLIGADFLGTFIVCQVAEAAAFKPYFALGGAWDGYGHAEWPKSRL